MIHFTLSVNKEISGCKGQDEEKYYMMVFK